MRYGKIAIIHLTTLLRKAFNPYCCTDTSCTFISLHYKNTIYNILLLCFNKMGAEDAVEFIARKGLQRSAHRNLPSELYRFWGAKLY